jgi:integrase
VKFKEQIQISCVQAGLRRATERSYWNWARAFIASQSAKSQGDLLPNKEQAVSDFLTKQAMRGCAASTQAQALNALVFLYGTVLKSPLGKLPEFKRPSRPAKIPAVPVSHDETMKLLESIPPPIGLISRLIYGCALRVNDALRIRIKDLDFANDEISIRESKGDKSRLVPMPKSLREELLALATLREAEHLLEKRSGKGWVHLPGLYGAKNPKAHFDSGWQYLFAAREYTKDPRSGNMGRHHVSPGAVQVAMRKASVTLKLKRNVTPHGLRHSAARRMKERGVPLHVIQQVLGHDDPATTMRYLGLGETIPKGISPLD